MHQNASLNPEDVKMPQNVCDPLKIIDLVKGNLSAILQDIDPEPQLPLPLDSTKSADDCEKGHAKEHFLAIKSHWLLQRLGKKGGPCACEWLFYR